MPRSNIPSRVSPATSNGSADLLPFLDPAPTGSMNQTSGKSKVLNGSPLNANGKRNSVSSSGESSGSDDADGNDEDGDEDGDSEGNADEDDEDATPGAFAPSYSKKSVKAYKTGPVSSPSARKKMKFDDDGYEGQASDSDSSDDSYEGVNDITDEDEEEHDVEKLEERMIVQSERNRDSTNLPSTDDGNIVDWSDFGVFDDQLLFSNTSFFDEDQYFSRYNQLDMQYTGEMVTEDETPTKRRVHFEERKEPSDNDKTPTPSSDDEDDDEIPSDFLQQDCLDPDLRRMIENDVDVNLRNQQRPYDDDPLFGDSYEQTGNIYHVDSDHASDGSSGYESMYLYCSLHLYNLLTDSFQRMMAKLPMRISRHQQQLRTHALSFVGTPVCL